MKGKKSELNLDRLVVEIGEMKYWHPLFKILRRELTKQGYWRDHPRGNPSKGYKLGWGKNKGE